MLIISILLFFLSSHQFVPIKNIPVKKPEILEYEEMPSKELSNTIPQTAQNSEKEQDVIPPVKPSKPKIDLSISIQSIKIQKPSTSNRHEMTFSSIPLQRHNQLKELSTKFKEKISKNDEKSNFSSESVQSCANPSESSYLDALNLKLNKFFNSLGSYFEQLHSFSQKAKEQPKIPGSRTRIIIDPRLSEFQKILSEKIEIFKQKLEESKKNIQNDLKIELRAIISQITSDLTDTEHLNQRIIAILSHMRSLDNQKLEYSIYIICEEVVQRGQDQGDSIDVGPNFALNFTNFIMTLAKSYPQIHEIYFIAVIKIKYSYFPRIVNEEIESIKKRTELKDINKDGRLQEHEKERFTQQMDRARAYAFLLGSLFACKESKFNEGDI